MSETAYADLLELARHLRSVLADNAQRKSDKSPFVLLYAFNGTGKTRLSAAFKDLGKVVDENDEVQSRDTLYFNAFTEDLFSWDNDLENDEHRTLKLNAASSFFVGLNELENREPYPPAAGPLRGLRLHDQLRVRTSERATSPAPR